MSLRAVFVTQEDPFYIAEFFRTFLSDDRMRHDDVEFLGAMILDTLGAASPILLARRMLGLYGPVGFCRLAMRYAIGRVRGMAHRWFGIGPAIGVEQTIAGAGFPVWHVPDINSPASVDALRSMNLDVILSISATQKFGADVLSTPRLGCFNSHSGALPRFRGMMPTFWTLYEGETEATVTIHMMAPKIDAGGIWRQEALPIVDSDSLDAVIVKTKRLSARMVWTLLEELRKGPVPLIENQESCKTYYKFPGAKESGELRRRGRRLL